MSYLSQAILTADLDFQNRTRAALTNQATLFKDDGRGDMAALANSLLTGSNPQQSHSFVAMVAAAPGFADQADNGDGTVDSSKIDDNQILAAVQAQWPTMAALFYNADGTPIV